MKLPLVTLFASLILGAAAYAQEPGAPPSQQKEQNDAQKVSVTGCLAKGQGGSGYTVTDQKSGQQVAFNGPAQLDKYVNQTVRLTGTVESQGGEKVFKPTAITSVSPSCEAGGKQ
jgi:hypothetical protein